MQATFQSKWSQLERMLQACLEDSKHHANRAARLVGSTRRPVTNLAKRIVPVAAVAIAATALSNTTGKDATWDVKDSFGIGGPPSSSSRITRVLHCCLAIAGCSAAQCALTHKPALGAKDPYKVARARVHCATKRASHTCVHTPEAPAASCMISPGLVSKQQLGRATLVRCSVEGPLF